MRVRIVGSSGNSCTPWPTCACRVCTQARERGGRDERYGNHVYLPDHALLTDASEHVFFQLDRQRIMNVEHLFISHWHPDHTAGIRIVQALAGFFLRRKEHTLKIYLTRAVHDEIVTRISPSIDYYFEKSESEIVHLEDGRTIDIGALRVTPITAPETPGGPEAITYFLFEEAGKRFLLAPDETKYLPLERPELSDLDLLVKECGYFTDGPDGVRYVPEGFEATIPDEITFEETLEQVRAIKAKRTILTELEELFQRTPEDYDALTAKVGGLVEFAHDGMEIEL